MSEFTKYRRTQIAEMRHYLAGERLRFDISMSAEDIKNGSPNLGDMIARNPKNHADQWLVAAQYFADNFEPMRGLAATPQEPSVVEVASVIHDARFGDDYPACLRNSFEGECASGRAYCIKLARAVMNGFKLSHAAPVSPSFDSSAQDDHAFRKNPHSVADFCALCGRPENLHAGTPAVSCPLSRENP